MSKPRRKQRSRRRKKEPSQPMLLTAYNYKLLVLGIVLVLGGFALMYLEGKQFGFISLYLSPIMVLAGFVVVAVSVFRTDPSLEAQETGKDAAGTDSGSETTSSSS
ncbi:hypothetical protein QA596_03945 [Balneolales bacterium ANBcel1]|nr:hypothetical protein [Balneolales bacterium ANBcel1]